jgi:hypothetical protein
MWETFVGDIPEGLSVDHIDSIRTSNNLSNFQLLTHAQQSHKENSNLIKAEHESGKAVQDWGTRKIKALTGVSRPKIIKCLRTGNRYKGWKFTIIKAKK